MATNEEQVKSAEVVAISQRLASMQKRKSKVNAELATLNRRVFALQSEAEELAKEHLTLLRKFDSVAGLP